MNYKTKCKLNKFKKSFMAGLTALMLMLSFNYAPISCLSNLASSNAYKSSSAGSYYTSSTTTDSSFSDASLPTSLKDYFYLYDDNGGTNSSGNGKSFNLSKYYSEKFNEFLSKHVEDFFKTFFISDLEHSEYYTKYQAFMRSKDYSTLLAYYTANASSLNSKYNVTDYKSFVEYFVSNEWTWKESNDTKSLEVLYSTSNSLWRSFFYNDLYKSISGEGSSSVEGNDGVTDQSDFYTTSTTYAKVKTFIETEIKKIITITTADGTTQNKNLAAIIATNAPTQTEYYYKEGTDNYVKSTLPKTTSYVSDSTTGNPIIYYFKTNSDLEISTTGYSVKNYSDLEEDDPLLYVQIESTDPNYNSQVPLYYKYSVSSSEKSTNIYLSDIVSGYANVYVLNDDPTLDETATYSALKYTNITSDDITNDTNGFYVKVPYSSTNTAFFAKISKYQTGSDEFARFVSLFTEAGESILYLRLQKNTSNLIYVDESGSNKTQADLLGEETKYLYQTEPFNYDSLSDYEKQGYVLVDSTYTNTYYKDGYKLYFKKTQVPYTTLDTSSSTYTGEYEMSSVVNIAYEKTTVPATSLEKHTSTALAGEYVIYVLNDSDVEISGITYTAKTADEIDALAGEYVSVPNSVSSALNNVNGTSYKFFYKHNTQSVNKIFIVDDSPSTTATEVYKNLHYSVITESEYNLNYSKFVAISSDDSNYNSNFTLYYKYDSSSTSDALYIQNKITNKKQMYVIDDSLTSSDISTYLGLNIISLSTSDYSADSSLYVQVPDEDKLGEYANYEKLYYKYKPTSTKKTVYLYTSKSSSIYQTFYNNNSTDNPYNYVAEDYERVEPTLSDGVTANPDYVEGLELYYKKIRTEKLNATTQNTYYYYESSSKVTLKANSFYMISFYVYTNGSNSDGSTDHKVEASVYVKDSSNVIEDIVIDKISTEGAWKKYCVFISTNTISDSSISLKLCLGNESSILGSAESHINDINKFSGVALFDNIKITKINETDYAKQMLDGEDVSCEYENDTVIVDKTTYPNNTYDNNIKNNVNCWSSTSWNNMFEFNNLTSTFGDGTTDNPGTLTLTQDSDGNMVYSNLWQYYLDRNNSGQGKESIQKIYESAYGYGDSASKKVSLSIIDESTLLNTKKDIYDNDDDSTEESSTTSSTESSTESSENDVKYVESTFEKNNKILKIKNEHRSFALGATSNTFTIEQSMYYKLTVWIYATDEDAKATIVLNSFLKTSTADEIGKLIQTSANVNAYLKDYTTEPTNEYGWIPISFYIEGNPLHKQDVSLALLADKNSTVYFDNISIQKITSATYDTAKSDSDDTTYTISLSGDAMMSGGVTNGYFNNITVTDNYNLESIDYSIPRTAKSWTVETEKNSTAVVAGVIPTNNDYISLSKNFYSEYNGGSTNRPTMANDLFYNVYGIYLPREITAQIDGASSSIKYKTTNVYKIYSSSTSLSANSIYKISFDFYVGTESGHEFEGKIVSALYHDSVSDDKLISSMSTETYEPGWNTFTYYVQTGNSSVSAYLEIGVENAVGTCFIKNVTSAVPSSSPKSIEEVRDNLLNSSENVASDPNNVYNKDSLAHVRFVNLLDTSFEMHKQDINADSNTYEDAEFTTSTTNTKDYTVGKTGIAVASYYDSTSRYEYSVTINKTEYYLGEVVESGAVTGYKLYSDSTRKTEVTTIDSQEVTISSNAKVTVGKGSNATDYSTTKTEIVEYSYKFNDDVFLNDNLILASELNNNHSQNVLILSNGKSTDYISITPVNSNSLKTTAYYVLKMYIKTSDFDTDNFGLNIKIDSISATWSNINTTKLTADEGENGFICYQVLIETNSSSIANLSAEISLGSEGITGKGYAIIAGIEVENYSTEKLFNEYAESLPEDETTIKKFFGTSSDSDDDSSDSSDDEDATNWTATFFYIFSSLLLGVVLIVALVAVFLKKHHISIPEKITNDHERETPSNQKKKSSNKKNVIDLKEKNQIIDIPSGDDDSNGFV